MTKLPKTSWSSIQWKDGGPPLTAKDTERAEHANGVAFPEAYRHFMLSLNGGKPQDSCFEYYRPKKQATRWTWIGGLYPIIKDSDRPSMSFQWAQELKNKHAVQGAPLPEGCILIGYTGGDDQLLLFVSGRRKGQVWVRDWNDMNMTPGVPTNPEDAVYHIADTFDAFIAMCCSDKEAEARGRGWETKRNRSGTAAQANGRRDRKGMARTKLKAAKSKKRRSH